MSTEVKKTSNKTLIILAVIIALLIATLVTIKVLKNMKEKKALQEAQKLQLLQTNSPAAGTGTNTDTSANDFPLQIGSRGDRVKALQAALNKIAPQFKLKLDGDFGKSTYDALITGFRATGSYPVTVKTYMEILTLSQTK